MRRREAFFLFIHVQLAHQVVLALCSRHSWCFALPLLPPLLTLPESLAKAERLTNHTRSTFTVGLPFVGSACGYIPGVAVSGGGAPHYEIPIATDHSCPLIRESKLLRPGQTITSERKYVPLTSSGKLTLKTDALFYSTTDAGQGNKLLTSVTSPLEGHWPSMQINVSPKVPVDRKLSFKKVGSHVFVTAPPEVRSHLVYLYEVDCQDFQDPGTTGSGNYGWESIATNEVIAPGCPGKNVIWSFAFGAPGYAIVYGSYTFP